MFAAFLSRDMTYSCGIFTDLDGDLHDGRELGAVNGAIGLKKIGSKAEGDKSHQHSNGEDKDELEEAQLRKIQ